MSYPITIRLEDKMSVHAVEAVEGRHEKARFYKALPSARHIRLLFLAIDAVQENESLRCAFVEQNIDTVVPWAGYSAISYVWGSSTKRVPIVCNNLELSITQNLDSALRQIWNITPRQVLWADAVCINQRDDLEKEIQVGVMGDIYKAATTVIVYLDGTENELSNLSTLTENSVVSSSRVMDEPLTKAILKHAWFSRAWTLQEIYFARKAVLLCGRTWIDWRSLCQNLGWGQNPLRMLREVEGITQHLDQFRVPSTTILTRLILATRDRVASDPRDRVYCLLGLIPEPWREISADYTISYWDLVERLVVNDLQNHQKLTLLHACGPRWNYVPRIEGRAQIMPELSASIPSEDSDQPRSSWLPDIANPHLLDGVASRDVSSHTLRSPRVDARILDGLLVGVDVHRPEKGVLRVRGILVGMHDCVRLSGVSNGHLIRQIPKCLTDKICSKTGPTMLTATLHTLWTRHALGDHDAKVLLRAITGDRTSIRAERPQTTMPASNMIDGWEAHTTLRCNCYPTKRPYFANVEPRAVNHDVVETLDDQAFPVPREYVHPHVQVGDLLCVLAFGDGLFFLRPQRGGNFSLVGSAFRSPMLPEYYSIDGRLIGTPKDICWPTPLVPLTFDIV
jgi:hypothetical protein